MSLVVGNRGHRAALVCAVATALAPVAIIPHVVEDAAAGELELFGLGLLATGLLLGVLFAVQILGALGGVRGWRVGFFAVIIPAALWIVGAVVDHPGAFLGGDFRAGLASRLAVWALIAFQVVALTAAISAMRSTRRTSFTGTGTYTKGGP
jgi:hypothetical protein